MPPIPVGLWIALFLLHGTADVPRLPFSGVYGATAGAGSLAGWDRHGGDNPAALGPPAHGASLAGYAPFGLDGLRVMEIDLARDAERWGASVAWRGFFDDAGDDDGHDGGTGASRFRAQGAWKFRPEWSGGALVTYETSPGTPGIGSGLGLLWRPHAALSLGAAWESVPTAWAREHRAGLGADFGSRFGRGSAWRIAAEYFLGPEGERETRYGFGLQLHPLLSIYAGLAPRQQTASLGVRFGMGGFEGFSALRRHAALGGTSIQGLRWGREGR